MVRVQFESSTHRHRLEYSSQLLRGHSSFYSPSNHGALLGPVSRLGQCLLGVPKQTQIYISKDNILYWREWVDYLQSYKAETQIFLAKVLSETLSFFYRREKFVDEAVWKQDKKPDIKSFTFLTSKTAQKCFLRNLQLHRCPNMVKFRHYLWAPPDKTVPFQKAVALGSKFISEVTIQVKTRLLNNTVFHL